MIRKSFVLALITAAILAGMVPEVTYAETAEYEVDESLLNASQEPVPDSDEKEIIESTFTNYTEESNGMIGITAIVPENFALSVYARVKNLDTGTIYNLPMYAVNGYFERCYVPAGNYSILMVGVYDDSTGKYSFDFPKNQFYVEEKQSAEFEIKLNDYENVEAQLNEKYAIPEDIGSKDNAEEIPKNVEKSGFEVKHTGTGTGMIHITGTQKSGYDLILKIVTSGGLAEATFIYSTNGGITWTEPDIIPLAGYYELGFTGLIANFEVSDEESFVAEDIYEAFIQDPDTNIVVNAEGSKNLSVTVTSDIPDMRTFDVLEAMGVNVQIKVLKTGDFGSAVWQISKDGGLTWSGQEYAREEVIITSDLNPELQVTIHFETDVEDTSEIFQRDDVYTIYAERIEDNSTTLMAIIIVVLAAVVMVALFLGNKVLKSAIPKESVYELRK